MRIVFDISLALERVLDRCCGSDGGNLEKILREIKELKKLIVRLCGSKRRVIFSQVRVNGGTVIKGDIKEMKAEIGQYVDATAAPVGGNGFQPGTESFVFSAITPTGEDARAQITETPVPGDEDNPLRRRYQHDGGGEVTATVLFRADGDRDLDEESINEATLVINFDEKNVQSVSLEGTAGTPE